MHTLVVTMTTDPNRTDEVVRHLRDDVTAWAKKQRGFVSGEWLLSEDRDAGLGIVVFNSAETADQASAGPRHFVADEQRAWNIASVTVYAPVAAASR